MQAVPGERLALVVIAVVLVLLLAETTLVNVLQGVSPLHSQIGHVDAGQRVLLWIHPRLQVGVVLPLPLWVLQARLVNLPHCLNK